MSQAMWKEFERYREDIELFAKRRADRSRKRLALLGHDLSEIDPIALVSHALIRAVDGPKRWDMSQQSCLEYFVEQIHNRVRYFEQLKRTVHLHIVPDDQLGDGVTEAQVAAETQNRHGESEADLEARIDRDRLLRFIGDVAPDMLPFARLVYSGVKPEIICRECRISPATRKRRTAALRKLEQAYREAVRTCEDRLAASNGED